MSMEELLPYQFEPEYSDREDLADDDDDDDSHSFPDLTHELETDRVGNIDWCSCGSCTAMETERECLCCQEYEELGDKMDFISCLTENASFVTVCLDGEVLRTALVCMSQTTGESFPDPPTHRYVQ